MSKKVLKTNNKKLIGKTYPVLDHGYVKLIDFMGTDERIVEAARVSYKAPSKGYEQDVKLLNYLWKNKHTSPFEMCKITLNIKMPIFILRQYIRHRMQNLNEVSARYTQLPGEFYIPIKWRKQDTKNKQGSNVVYDWDIEVPLWDGDNEKTTQNKEFTKVVESFCKSSYELYESFISQGMAREMARMILPLNTYSEFYCCWDLKNLLHFISLREDSHAQSEIQEYAKAIKEILKQLFPETIKAFDKYKWKLVDDKDLEREEAIGKLFEILENGIFDSNHYYFNTKYTPEFLNGMKEKILGKK